MCDGAVRFVNESVDIAVYKATANIDGKGAGGGAVRTKDEGRRTKAHPRPPPRSTGARAEHQRSNMKTATTTFLVRFGGLGLVAALLLAAGCGEAGPARYHVSGKVTFNGQPVPAGQIVFEPDPTAGNLVRPAMPRSRAASTARAAAERARSRDRISPASRDCPASRRTPAASPVHHRCSWTMK